MDKPSEQAGAKPAEKPSAEELRAAVYWIAEQYQQNYYEINGDWNKYSENETMYLRNYIGYALYGPPEYEKIFSEDEIGLYVYEEKGAADLIESIFSKIIEHGTQLTEDNAVLCSALYCCIYDDSSLSKYDIDQLHESIQIIPIFKVQKCIKRKDKRLGEIITYEDWYVDTEARVYKCWNDYLRNNNLPTCIMIAPKHGVYQADLKEIWSAKASRVWVEAHRINTSKKITNTLDIASTIVNVGCIGIGVAAVFNPITAPVAIAGAVGGAVSGLWSGGRAVGELVDRGTHDQSISVLNRHAIPAWLGVAGSTLGLAASSGSALLSRAIRTGTSVGRSARLAHDAIMISNLCVNSIGGCYNGVSMYQKYRETGEISAKDVFFLTAHVLFICNSAVKMRFASDIIKADQTKILEDYEASLRSNRHRKEFRRLVANTGEVAVDEIHRNEQIIRSLTKINNRDEFFATMVQNRKTFASTGTQLSFAEGQVQVNGVTLINPSVFSSMSKDGIRDLISQVSTSSPTTTPTSSTPSMSTVRTSNLRNIVSSNALKSGITTVRDFCVKQAITPSEVNTNNLKHIFGDLQNLKDSTKIIQLLLETGMCICVYIQKIVNTPSERRSEVLDEMLVDATNFVWDIVKINLARKYPRINMLVEHYEHEIQNFAQSFYDYVKSNSGEWVKVFRRWKDAALGAQQNSETEEDSDEKDKKEQRYNDIKLLDPGEVMALHEEVSLMLVQEALSMTGSQMTSDESLPKDMAKLCEDELNDFFAKHPNNLDFKLTDLSKDFKGILIDLSGFEKKNIIFYKLVVISINIVKGVDEASGIKKDVFVDIMKCLWIFVNINFTQILPDTNMFNSEFESTVMNIIIALYEYQLAEPDKWLSAFFEYREKFGKK